MGGAIGLGNVTPSAEFNILADPEAAHEVIASGVPFTLVPLEVTHLALATPAEMARIADLGTRVARLAVELMDFFAETYRRVFGFAHPPVHDPCAVAAVIEPAIVATTPTNVRVDLGPGLSTGRTVCDVYGTSGLAPNVDLGHELGTERFWDLMLDALGRYPD
jgi:inosine-uridine nucleoside N-ribohydrolase